MVLCFLFFSFFFFNDTATTEIYTLSLHDALPICLVADELPNLLDKVDDEVHDGQAPQAGRKHPEVLAQEIGHEERHGVPRMSYRRMRRWNSQTMTKTKTASGNQAAAKGLKTRAETQKSPMTLRT